jgi:transcriptional regulator with XRE-family HTH domain
VEEIRRIRKERGLTQRGLAAASGVDQATISQVESGKHRPNLETLDKLAEALSVGVAEFFPKPQPSLFEAVERRRRSKATEARRIAEEINLPPDLDSGNIVDVMRDVEDAERRRDRQQLRRVVESGESQVNYGSVSEEFEHRLEDLLGWTFLGGFLYSGLRAAVHRILDLEEENARLKGEVEATEKVRSE